MNVESLVFLFGLGAIFWVIFLAIVAIYETIATTLETRSKK